MEALPGCDGRAARDGWLRLLQALRASASGDPVLHWHATRDAWREWLRLFADESDPEDAAAARWVQSLDAVAMLTAEDPIMLGAVESNAEVRRVIDEVVARGPEEGQTGVAIAVGGRVAGVETFANPDDLRTNWSSIITSAMLELTDEEIAAADGEATVADIEDFLRRVAAAEATEAQGTGLGTEWHVATESFVAHALADDSGEVIHAYAFAEI